MNYPPVGCTWLRIYSCAAAGRRINVFSFVFFFLKAFKLLEEILWLDVTFAYSLSPSPGLCVVFNMLLAHTPTGVSCYALQWIDMTLSSLAMSCLKTLQNDAAQIHFSGPIPAEQF